MIRRNIDSHIKVKLELALRNLGTAYVSTKLNEFGIPHTKGVKTGIIALLEGKNPVLASRVKGDMDALSTE